MDDLRPISRFPINFQIARRPELKFCSVAVVVVGTPEAPPLSIELDEGQQG